MIRKTSRSLNNAALLTRRRKLARWLAAAALVATSATVLAQNRDSPESLLPPGFDPPATRSPSPTPTPRATRTGRNRPTPSPSPTASATPSPAPTPAATSSPLPPPVTPPTSSTSSDAPDPGFDNVGSQPVIQPLPTQRPAGQRPTAALPPVSDIGEEVLDEFSQGPVGYDIPPAAQRSLSYVGVISQGDGGLPEGAAASTGGRFLGFVLKGTDGPILSRWGSILLRRALLSRIQTPSGIGGADFAALRAKVLLNMGEQDAARALVQEVDSSNYTPLLYQTALDSYVATSDLVGICPVVGGGAQALKDDSRWTMARAICAAFSGEQSTAVAQLQRAERAKVADRFDLLLAEKLVGAASRRRSVTIEWDGVNEMTPWRYGLALSTGLQPPDSLLDGKKRQFASWDVRSPILPLAKRLEAADYAAGSGVLSSAAMVDLWSTLYDESDQGTGNWNTRAAELRTAYAAKDPAARVSAMQSLWESGGDELRSYGRKVLTAYAAARIPVSEDHAASADGLIASMLAAGLDRNALRWGRVVPEGSDGWAMLVLAAPVRDTPVSEGAIDSFYSGDDSPKARKSAFLLAGLAGLGRVEAATVNEKATDWGINLSRRTGWTRAIDEAAERGDQATVAYLAGLGMQGSDWSKMTPLYLFHITSALRRSGLEAEARMIAAEAIARGG